MDNKVGLAGYIADVPQQKGRIYGKDGLQQVTVTVSRTSGVKDSVIVMYDAAAAQGEEVGQGDYVIIMGRIQTHQDKSTGRVTVFVLADYIGRANKRVAEENCLILDGEVAREVIYRTSPKNNRKIAEVIIKTPSAFRGGYYSYIPTICWGDNAKRAKEYREGKAVRIEGRIQSREYIKRLEDGAEETRRAYEISVSNITEM